MSVWAALSPQVGSLGVHQSRSDAWYADRAAKSVTSSPPQFRELPIARGARFSTRTFNYRILIRPDIFGFRLYTLVCLCCRHRSRSLGSDTIFPIALFCVRLPTAFSRGSSAQPSSEA